MLTLQLEISHAFKATFLIFLSMSFLMCSLVDRRVPPIVTVSGMTLKADPPSILVSDKTAFLNGSNCLEIRL